MEYNGISLIVVLWGIVLFGCGIGEMVVLRGNLFHFSLGALGAVICYLLGFDIPVQIAVFAVVTLVSFLVLKPLFIKLSSRNETVHEEGLDLLVGLEGKVISKIDMDAGTGRVDIDGRPVKAIPVDPQQKYNVGDRIYVTGLDGDRLVVRKAKKRK